MVKKGLKRIQDHVRQVPAEIAKLKADIQAATPAQRPKLEADLKLGALSGGRGDRKSTRLNSSHLGISYAVFCLKKKKTIKPDSDTRITGGVNLVGVEVAAGGCTAQSEKTRAARVTNSRQVRRLGLLGRLSLRVG